MQALGADLVVFFQAPLAVAQKWFELTPTIPRDLPVVADETGDLYRGLGTNRPDWYKLIFGGGFEPMRRARAAGFRAKASRSDMRRLGADIVIDAEGEIRFLHLAETADDRVDPSELLRELAGS
jgi:hypothetical protein